MSVTITVSDQVIEHLNHLHIGATSDVDSKLRSLLEAEYRRRLAQYSLTNRQLSEKYRMDFQAFERQQMTKQLGYSWEVESDAMAWETAVDGIDTVKRLMSEVEEILVSNELL